ncbi:MAG: DUF559 domain-containing protein, partial [Bacteroidetes bacterium]|nr:DUF559 domain-containing protein [Bacteroidota bacterium]
SGDNGPKYLQPGGEETNIERIDTQNIGRDVGGLNVSQLKNFFISSESDFQPRNEHIGMQPERVDVQNVGRKNPVETEEVKYEEVKKYDEERTDYIINLGIKLIRFENQEVLYNLETVLKSIEKEFKKH